MSEVRDNAALRRYEMAAGAETAFVSYWMDDGVIALTHAEVPRDLWGQGIGSALARAVLEDVRRRGLRVVPACPFIAAYIDRHPEFADLVAG